MADRIVWEATDGTILVTIPVEVPLPAESEEEYLDRIAAHAAKADPSLAACTRLPNVRAADLPGRRFRNAWRPAGGKVIVHMPLAREQVLAEIRTERNARLDASDREQARLADVGTKAEVDAIKLQRQALRDLPEAVAADLSRLTTVEALESYKPTWPDATKE